MLPTRLARLTLYSGTNCSLCDVCIPRFICIHHILITSQVAKAQLTKIRQTVNINPFFAFVAVHSAKPPHPSAMFFFPDPLSHLYRAPSPTHAKKTQRERMSLDFLDSPTPR